MTMQETPEVAPDVDVHLDGAIDADQVAAMWLRAFDAALSSENPSAVASLFAPAGYWRDQLGLGWDLRTLHGQAAITQRLSDVLPGSGAGHVKIEGGAALVETPDTTWVQAKYSFETAIATGVGIVRLTPEADSSTWRAWTALTRMVSLKGHEELTGANRPHGVEHGGTRSQESWQECRAKHLDYQSHEPEVVILGAGQGGLALAARLSALGIDALIIERNDRVGDNWRKRYKSLVLHDPVHTNHMPYVDFPATWPLFTPKDKLADWFESYVSTLDLNVWTATSWSSGRYDSDTDTWEITVTREGPQSRTLRPKHLVLATGVSGFPSAPTISRLEDFIGSAVHSSAFSAGEEHRGQRVTVIGAGNSAHDIAHDLAERGADVTMVQRSSTHVMSSANGFDVLFAGLFGESGPALSEADLIGGSLPLPVAFQMHEGMAGPEIMRRDAEMHAGLAAAGYKHNPAGLQYPYHTRGGGYYIDVGAAQAIAEGRIKVKQGVEITSFTPTGLVFADGTTIDSDVVVMATGFGNMREVARTLLGDEIADQCSLVWGLDEEGELRSVWRRSGFDGLWFMGGNLSQARTFSELLALQIKAIEAGLSPRHTSAGS